MNNGQLPMIAGIGGTFELDGKTWTWSPLTIGDMAAYEAEMRSLLGERLNIIGSVKRDLDAAGVKGADRNAAMEQAVKEHVEIGRMSAFRLAEKYELPDATACLFRHCLLKHHPELTIDDVRAMIGAQVVGRVLYMVLQQLAQALPGKDWRPTSGEDSASSKKETRRKRKKRTGRSSSGTSARRTKG